MRARSLALFFFCHVEATAMATTWAAAGETSARARAHTRLVVTSRFAAVAHKQGEREREKDGACARQRGELREKTQREETATLTARAASAGGRHVTLAMTLLVTIAGRV